MANGTPDCPVCGSTDTYSEWVDIKDNVGGVIRKVPSARFCRACDLRFVSFVATPV